MTKEAWIPIGRRAALLTRGADPALQRGVEFGALVHPVVRPSQGDIKFVDYTTTEYLRAYPHASSIFRDQIVEVDYVWPGTGSLAEVIGQSEILDYAIASHVIEHVPNVLGWFRGICEVLRPGGVLNLAIPDRRYTFDIRREPSTLGELVEADLLGFQHRSVRQVFEHAHRAADLAPGEPWRSEVDPDTLAPFLGENAIFYALDAAKTVHAEKKYSDSHCWVFTPTSFLNLMYGATMLDLIPFELSGFEPTIEGEFEFFATWRRPLQGDAASSKADRLRMIDGHRSALEEFERAHGMATPSVYRDREALRERVADLEHELRVVREELDAQREAFMRSTSWRVTAPFRALRRFV